MTIGKTGGKIIFQQEKISSCSCCNVPVTCEQLGPYYTNVPTCEEGFFADQHQQAAPDGTILDCWICDPEQTCEEVGNYFTDEPTCGSESYAEEIQVITEYGQDLDCWQCTPVECLSGSGIAAAAGGGAALGVTVTNERPHLTITSSGNIDLICPEYWKDGDHWSVGGPCYPKLGMKCTRPNAPFTAPAQLRIYVGGVLLSDGSNFNGVTALRGAVTANIRDSGYYDNCGFYAVGATVCEI